MGEHAATIAALRFSWDVDSLCCREMGTSPNKGTLQLPPKNITLILREPKGHPYFRKPHHVVFFQGSVGVFLDISHTFLGLVISAQESILGFTWRVPRIRGP